MADRDETVGASWKAKKEAWARAQQTKKPKGRGDGRMRGSSLTRAVRLEEMPQALRTTMVRIRGMGALAERRGRELYALRDDAREAVRDLGQRTVQAVTYAARLAMATAFLPFTLARLALRRPRQA